MFSFYVGIFSPSSRFFLCLFLFFTLIYSFSSASSLDSQKFVPLSEIEVGDVFTARTRMENNVMHSFPVQVVSVVKMGTSKHPSIIAVSDDPLIMETRIASGMSGSPVYDGERLVGAIAFAWEFAEKPVMGITPIEEMLPIFDYQGKEPHDIYGEEIGFGDSPRGRGPWQDSSQQILSQYAMPEFYQFLEEESRRLPVGGARIRKWIAKSKTRSIQKEIDPSRDTGAISLPLMVSFSGPWGNSGTPPSGWGALKRWLLPGVEIFPSFSAVSTAGGDQGDDTDPLVPGDYIGVNLVRGDVELSAFGTVTYTEGDTLLAFGHSFGLRGAIRLPLYRARTEMVVPLQSVSFKLGKLGREIGTVEQDRETGIMGKIGGRAPYLPIEVSLDTPLRKESYRFEVVNDKMYSTFLPGFILEQIFYSEESVGRPIRLHYQVRVDYTPTVSEKHSIVLSNRTETRNLGVNTIASELVNLMAMIQENNWEVGVVTNVAIHIVSRPGSGFMQMATVQTSETIYRPGEEIRFQVGFDRYREPRVYREFTYAIPPETKDGNYRLAISPALIRWIVEKDLSETPSLFTSLDKISAWWASRPSFNQLSIWSLEEKGNLVVKDRVYRHLPANQQKILLHSLHSEKDKVVGVQYRDYDLEETPMGFLSLPYRVQRNYKD